MKRMLMLVVFVGVLLFSCKTAPVDYNYESNNTALIKAENLSATLIGKEYYSFITSNRDTLKIAFYDSAAVYPQQLVYVVVDYLDLNTMVRKINLYPAIVYNKSGHNRLLFSLTNGGLAYVYDSHIFSID